MNPTLNRCQLQRHHHLVCLQSFLRFETHQFLYPFAAHPLDCQPSSSASLLRALKLFGTGPSMLHCNWLVWLSQL